MAARMSDRRNGSPTGSIVVVGPCAAGKSTLVRALRLHGFDAYVCAQEHSDIPTLWRHQSPSVVIALQVDLESTRLRRDSQWRSQVFAAQQARLRNAYEHADLVIDTVDKSAGEVVAAALQHLRTR
jgi:GTPase SAR1 family protein